MVVGLVVGPKFRGLQSIRRYVERLRSKPVLVLRSPPTQGETLAQMTASRTGLTVRRIPSGGDSAGALMAQRVDIVKLSDRIVMFDDSSAECEHIVNLAAVNKKPIERFREV